MHSAHERWKKLPKCFLPLDFCTCASAECLVRLGVSCLSPRLEASLSGVERFWEVLENNLHRGFVTLRVALEVAALNCAFLQGY